MSALVGIRGIERAGTGAAAQTDPLEAEASLTTADTLCLRVAFDFSRACPRDIGSGSVLALRPGSKPVLLGRDSLGKDGLALLGDRSVSRHHVELKLSQDERSLQLRTLGARNDTFVDGANVQGTCVIGPGSVLRIGGSLLLVSTLSGEPQREAGEAIRGLWGSSAALQKVRWLVSRRADSRQPVSIWGESGVGKELIAEALHNQSGRRDRPLIKVNCATLNPALAASELFGHQQGAFTGATRTTKGLFGEAAGGTLFLDEVHRLPADVQGQLLRTLDSGKVRPIGGGSEQDFDVRVVAASNRDLRALNEESEPPFLPDLRARLGDWYRIHIPPLRERREDILPIFAKVLEQAAVARGREQLLELRLSWRLAEVLLTRLWMNNVRDLRTVAQALVELTPDEAKCLSTDVIEELLPPAHDVEDADAQPSPAELPVKDRRKRGQRLNRQDEIEVRLALTRHLGNVKAAEAETGVNERTIRRLVERWRTQSGSIFSEEDSGAE